MNKYRVSKPLNEANFVVDESTVKELISATKNCSIEIQMLNFTAKN
jgi:hypothetical protein